MTELFSHNDSSKWGTEKAPTTYNYYKTATKAQMKAKYPVKLIFKPSGDIGSWGFIADEVRFNIYPKDSRFKEIEGAIKDVVLNKQELFITYSENDRGLATLILGKAETVVWDNRGYMLVATK